MATAPWSVPLPPLPAPTTYYFPREIRRLRSRFTLGREGNSLVVLLAWLHPWGGKGRGGDEGGVTSVDDVAVTSLGLSTLDAAGSFGPWDGWWTQWVALERFGPWKWGRGRSLQRLPRPSIPRSLLATLPGTPEGPLAQGFGPMRWARGGGGAAEDGGLDGRPPLPRE